MLNASLALWYDSQDIQVDGHEPCVELHFNMWRDLPGSKTDALDIGIRIQEKHAIEKLNFFIPAQITLDNVADLSSVLKDKKTLSAVFNENLSIGRDPEGVFSAVKQNGVVSFHVIILDMLNEIELIPIGEPDSVAGTVIQFKHRLFERMQSVGDYYIRIRIYLNGHLKNLFFDDYNQAGRIFVSAFYSTDIVEFRLNEQRSFPAALLQQFEKMKMPTISAIYYILVRDLKSELIRSHTEFHKIRRLEKGIWLNYLSSLTKNYPDHMILYHWRVKATQETIEDFIALASFRTVRHGLWAYILGILLLGMAGNAFETFAASALSERCMQIWWPMCLGTGHLGVGILATALVLILYLMSGVQKRFASLIRRDSLSSRFMSR